MMNEDDTPQTDLPLDVPSIHDEEKAVKEDLNEEEDIAGIGYVPYHPYPGPIPPIPPAHWTDEYQVSFAHCVLEFPSRNIFPAVAKKGKLYVAWDTNKIYRWDGKTYVELSGGGGSPVAALASLTLTQGGRTLGVFNPSGNDKSIDIPFPTIPVIPTKLSELEDDVGYITSVSWDEVSNKPNFANVAFTGSYDDLTDLPSLFSGDYNDLINKPEIPVLPQFATVATTGKYSDLIETPTIPVVPEKVSEFANDAGYITADDIPEVPAPGNGTLTIKQGDSTLGTFSANAGQDAEINIPTQAIPEQVNADWNSEEGVSKILNKPTLPLSIENGGTGATTKWQARENLSAVGTTGDINLTGDYATTGYVSADYLVADESVNIGVEQIPDAHVIIYKRGYFSLHNGTASTSVAIPGGKQSSDPMNTMPVLATVNQIPSLAAPSTNASAAGKAADAKATGDALVGKLSKVEAEKGLTEWEFTPSIPDNTKMVWKDALDGIPAGWGLETIDPGTTPTLDGSARLGNKDSTDITWEADDYAFGSGEQTYRFTATRTRLPTMADLNLKQDALTDPQMVALNWAIEYRQQILAAEALGRYTVSTSGSANRIADEATSITLTATVTTKFKDANNVDILVDSITPSGWTKTAIGTYTKSIEGATGTVASEVFKYTVEGEVNSKYEAIEVSKNSDAKSISVTYPIYYGFAPTNSMSDLISDGVLDISSLHLTRGTAKVSNASATLTNGLSSPGYYWILTHGSATATQVGTSILNNPESVSKLRSPQNGHADIEMTGYKLYISSNSVSVGGAIDRVAITINI